MNYDSIDNTDNLSGKQKLVFWVLFIGLMVLAVYGCYVFLSRQVYDLSLWQKLIEDPDHRLAPDEKKGINADGIRSKREAEDFIESDFNIIFSGDSYTYGHLLGTKQTPPMQFELIANQQLAPMTIRVANFGWSSSSPYLSLRLLKDIGKKYKPDLVIFILDATDFKDDHFYSSVIEKKSGYEFIVDHPLLAHFPRKIALATDNYTGWHERWLGYPGSGNYFLFHQPYQKSLPFFESTYQNLVEMNKYVSEQLGAKFIVFAPPRHWQYTDKESPLSWERHNYTPMSEHVLNNFAFWDEKAGEAPFPIVSLLEDFQSSSVYPTTFKKDSHWNPQGARFAAHTMFEHCLKLQCFD